MLKIPPWTTKAQDENDNLVLFNWENNQSAIIHEKDHPVYALRLHATIDEKNKNHSDQHLDDITWLIENNLLTTEKYNKLPEQNTPEKRKLHLILLPAGEACNLDCIYCYEDHNDKSRMSEKTAEAIVKFIEKYNPEETNIEYFGGEPMLNIKFIQHLGQLLIDRQIKFSASITTNGTLLTDDNLIKIYNAGVKSFQITLDGAEENHNKLRPANSIRINSHKSVCSGIEVLSKSSFDDINVIIRTNSNSATIIDDRLALFIGSIKKLVRPQDERFYFLPKPIGDYSSANLKTNDRAEKSYCKPSDTGLVISTIEKSLLDAGYALADALMLVKHGGYSCYAGKENSFVITPKLTIHKCTVALNDPINSVGQLEYSGDIILNDNFDLWTKDYSNSDCATCFAKKTCQGNSCPLANIKSNKKQCAPVKSSPEIATIKVVKFFERKLNASN